MDNYTSKSNELIINDSPYLNIKHRETINHFESNKSEIFSVKFSKSDLYLAYSTSNGRIHILEDNKKSSNKNQTYFNTNQNINKPSNSNNTSYSSKSKILASEYAVTSIRFKGDSSLISTTAEGVITTWHSSTGKKLHSLEEKDNPIMCLDINSDCSKFATAGHDKIVRLYDDETKSLISALAPSYNEVGHSNRIFSVCFHKEETDLLVSGGWDKILVFYDARTPKIIGNILGVNISGDAIDLKDNLILTGAYDQKNHINIFDIRTMSLLEKYEWDYEKQKNKKTYAYCAQFNKKNNIDYNKNNYFSVGFSNNNLWRIFNYDEENSIERNKACGLDNMLGSVYSLDFCNNNSETIALGCGDGKIKIFDIINKK